MRKRILSVILIMTFILCLFPAGVGADSEEYGKEAIIHLENLGILPSDTDGDAPVTRGEFACMVYNLAGRGEPVSTVAAYTDLGVDNPCYDEIQFCVMHGYMGGYNGLIRPDDMITYIEGMTVIARVLNYADYAKNNGDYTLGYYTTAKMLGILNNSGITSSDGIMLYKNAAAMLYNALRCSVNRLSEINSLYYTYTSYDRILAYDTMGLNYASGVMTSNGYTDISGDERYGKNLLVIGGNDYISRNIDKSAGLYIGQKVSIFYDDDRNVVSIAPVYNDSTLRISRSDFGGYSSSAVEYNDGERTLKAITADNVQYFLNGQPVLDFESTGFKDAEFADIYMVDNNNDSVYDVVFVNVYDTFVVHSVDTQGGVVSLNNSKYVQFGDENDKDNVIFNGSGKVISVDDIKEGSIISVAETDDYIYAVCVNGNIPGTLESIDDHSITVDGLEFDVPNGTDGYFVDVSVGDYINAYFDFDGRLVYLIKSTGLSDGTPFGYLVGCEFKSGLDNRIRLKIFDKNGKMQIYSLNNKFKINDVTYNTGRLSSVPEELLKNTVIMYKLNSDDEITSVDFPRTYFDEDEDGFIQTYQNYTQSLSSIGTMYGKIFINANTAIFVVPADLTNDDGYDIVSKSELPTSTSHTVDAFHFSKKNNFADVLVVHGISVKNNYNTPLSVVMSVYSGLDDDGNEVVYVKHFCDNEEIVSCAKAADVMAVVSSYSEGDAVRLSVTSDGYITDCCIVYDYGTGMFTKPSNAGTYATHSLYVAEGYVANDDGTVLRLSGNTEKLLTSDVLKLDGFIYTSAKIIIVEDGSKKLKVSMGTSADLKTGDHIILQSRSGTTRYIVIYRDK